ncbi:MAG: 2'-5' RNA ligase [Proteobacteria bacterium SG_bin5]|nr:RNA 2',3'-cyclic phosphodiesterase [Sphingomonas sp.]OQW39650.1 MAG: 2'-5' RNA ligase [Proteobacteria bacterium SG_bin5]
MHRLFVALRPPPAIRARLSELMAGIPDARWQSDAQLHLTLRYIGEVDARMADDVLLALGQLRGAAPEVALAGVGRFGGERAGDALWAGVAPAAPLALLHKKVDQALARIGLPREGRAYLPHITIARLPRRASAPAVEAFLARHAGLASAPFVMDALLLYESRLGQEGAHYEAVARWPLDAAAPAC